LIISQRQSQLRQRKGMNIFVMLLMLFVVSGHCTAAMLLAPQMADKAERIAPSVNHCGQIASDLESGQHDAARHDGIDCWDDSCTTSVTPLQSHNSSPSKDNQADMPLLVLTDYDQPLATEGLCRIQPRTVSAEFISPPLFYSLCVLRL
tara:strand:+ start:118 stop:564 length:447 start_codon:yes stop_codon:yes gene_type:complete